MGLTNLCHLLDPYTLDQGDSPDWQSKHLHIFDQIFKYTIEKLGTSAKVGASEEESSTLLG